MNTSRVLYVEEGANDVSLLQASLEAQAIPAEILHVTTADGFLAALSHKAPTLILADSNVPDFGAREALKLAQNRCPEIPFFCLTGEITEASSIAMYAAGANGCLCKDNLEAVGVVIRRVNDCDQAGKAADSTRGSDRRDTAPVALPRLTSDDSVMQKPSQSLIPVLKGDDAKLLFVLLDAADEDGRLRGSPCETRWRQARSRFIADAYEGDGSVFWVMLDDLDQTGLLEGSWILQRWRTVKARLRTSGTSTSAER